MTFLVLYDKVILNFVNLLKYSVNPRRRSSNLVCSCFPTYMCRLLEMVRRLEEGGSSVAVVEVGSGMLDTRVKVR